MKTVIAIRSLLLIALLLTRADAADDAPDMDTAPDADPEATQGAAPGAEPSGGGAPPLPEAITTPHPTPTIRPPLRGAPQSTVGAGTRHEEPLAVPVTDEP